MALEDRKKLTGDFKTHSADRLENTDHPLKGLYLLRYCHEGLVPAASILDPPKGVTNSHDAGPDFEHVAKLLAGSPMARVLPDDPAALRAYTLSYIDARQEMEGYLRGEAQGKGVKPENASPLYFVLHHDPNPNPPLMGGNLLSIPAENVPASLVSFTVDDSFYNFPSKPTSFRDPSHGTVFNSAEMADVLKDRGWLGNFPGVDHRRYYEAQLWTRRLDDFKVSALEPTSPSPEPRSSTRAPDFPIPRV